MTKASWNKSVVFVGMDDIDDCSSDIESETSWHEGFWKIVNTITKGPICSQISDGFRVEYWSTRQGSIDQQGKVGCKKGLFSKCETWVSGN